MANINELLARAAALRDETALNSISPERAGGIMYDTLLAMNELWLQQGAALVISKIYASVAAMEADTAPVSDLTGQPLRPGQIVVIASSDSDNGSVYRYNGTSSPSWSLVGEIGNLEPVDSLDSDSTSLPLAAHQGKVLDGKISQLGQDVIKSKAVTDYISRFDNEWFSVDGVWNAATGDFPYSPDATKSTPILPLTNDVFIRCYLGISGPYGIVFFDENKQFMSGVSIYAETAGINDTHLTPANIPIGAKYFSVPTIADSALSKSYVEIRLDSYYLKQFESIDTHFSQVESEIDDINEEISERDEWVEFTTGWETDKFFNGYPNPVGEDSSPLQGTKCQRFSGLAGKTIRIYANTSTEAVPLYMITDSSRNKISVFYSTTESFRETPKEVTIPSNGYYVYINLREYASGDKVEESVHIGSVTERIGALEEKDETIENEIAQLDERIEGIEENLGLTGKTIVVFGDSISEFKGDSGKGWTDYASEITKATIINCAIGGTKLMQRHTEIPLFDASKTYNVGDWVFYKPSDVMNCYECTNQHTGAWDSNDFQEIQYYYYVYANVDIINLVKAACNTAIPTYADRFVNQDAAVECIAAHFSDDKSSIISRLKSIDWTKVDAVVVMAGTNDFGADSTVGTPGSTDINTTYGAINEIVRILNSTYKKAALFYNSITVRWYDYSGGTGDVNKWCDVYLPPSSTQTLNQFAEGCMNEFRNNHIPVLDLYNTLGWNKYNFSNFFRDNDGTHPFKGFSQLGEKISSFLVANKSF